MPKSLGTSAPRSFISGPGVLKRGSFLLLGNILTCLFLYCFIFCSTDSFILCLAVLPSLSQYLCLCLSLSHTHVWGRPLCSTGILSIQLFLCSSCCCCCCCWVASVVSDSVPPHRRQPTRLPRPWDSPGKNTGVGCHILLQYMKVKSESEVAQPCPTLSDPMDCSLPGSSVLSL